jgi:hypothetical protein
LPRRSGLVLRHAMTIHEPEIVLGGGVAAVRSTAIPLHPLSAADVGGAAVTAAISVLPPPRSCTTTLLYERDRKFGEVNDLRCNRPRDQIADRTHAACSHHDPIAAQSLGA